MSLEDPTSIETLPRAPGPVQRRTGLHDVKLPQLAAFGKFFGGERRTVIEEDPDMPWHERLVIRCARLGGPAVQRLVLAFVGMLVFVLCAMAVRYAFGYDAVVPAFVARDSRILHSNESPLAYLWLHDKPDSAVSAHVVSARATMGLAVARFVLVGTAADDTAPARDLECERLSARELAARTAYIDLMSRAEQFLAEAGNGSSCVCAPQLGSNANYIAFRNDAALGSRVMHIFNPVDATLDAYEQLDAERLAQLGVGLARATTNQDYRYNAQRGTYILLRRLELSITGVDLACVRERIGVKASAALQAEECLDLLRGIDVRERARRQLKRGVLLNAAALAHQDL